MQFDHGINHHPRFLCFSHPPGTKYGPHAHQAQNHVLLLSEGDVLTSELWPRSQFTYCCIKPIENLG